MANNNPIINSLMDLDFYKFTMGRLVYERYADVPVVFAFKCRNQGIKLAQYFSKQELCAELDHVKNSLRFNNSEIHYLRGTNEYSERMFPEDYLSFLRNLSLPDYRVVEVDDSFQIEVFGSWSSAIYWETIILSVVSELYYRGQMAGLSKFEKELVYCVGRQRLAQKIAVIRRCPKLSFCDFGTRRRFSRDWQDYVVGVLAEELPGQMRGTSNVELAMKHGLLPMGTSAHELFMIMAGINGASDDGLLKSHGRVLEDWWDMYGQGLSIFLSDTFGTAFAFRDIKPEQAAAWKGFRHDSGDPFAFGEKVIQYYKSCGIDPRQKLIVFSDGLDVYKMVKLHDYFAGRINTSYGWGTNLTNDLGFKSLSLVVKPIEACGRPLVKLSDNVAKAIGPAEEIERYKRVFGYDVDFFESCVY